MRPKNPVLILLSLVWLTTLPAAASAKAPLASKPADGQSTNGDDVRCIARCGGGSTVECAGESCYGLDGHGCRSSNDDGRVEETSCEVPLVSPVADGELVNGPARRAKVAALEEGILNLTGRSVSLDGAFIVSALAGCSAPCGGGEAPIQCSAEPGEHCWASFRKCTVVRPDGSTSVKTCGLAPDY
ncbi:MAG: hypothetical protein AAGN66_14535 [Acidobacteriota bacterium]